MIPRLAQIEDAELLLKWRNDPETRRNSRQQSVVTIENHRQWLEETLRNQTRKLFVIEHEGVDVATIRCDWREGECELSWTVAPEHRGKGYAFPAIRSVMDLFPDVNFVAEIKVDNVASIKAATRAGIQIVLLR